MTYRIITTGSIGNALLMDDLLIDAGISKKRLQSKINLDTIHHVFISHRHVDHCSLPLVRYFIKSGTHVYLPQGVADKISEEGKLEPSDYPNTAIFSKQTYFKCGEYEVVALPQSHWDIVNYAFAMRKGEQTYLYSTDLDTLDPSDKGVGLHHLGKFDIIFLEGNYDENWLREYIINTMNLVDDKFDYNTLTSTELNEWIRNNRHQLPHNLASGLYRAVQNMRHLSKQTARAYVSEHLKPNGKYYEMHRSSLFYEKPTEWENVDIWRQS